MFTAAGSSHFVAWYTAVCVMSLFVLATLAVIYSILFLSLSGALERISGRQNSSAGAISSTGKPSRHHDAQMSTVKRAREVRQVARKMLWVSFLDLFFARSPC